MAQVIVFGATGKTGQQIVHECLGTGHQVTAFIRQAEYSWHHANLKVYQGDLANPAALDEALYGQDVVISALGNRNYADPMQVIHSAVRGIVPAMSRSGTRRIIILAGAGLLQHDATTMIKDLPNQHPMFRYPREDHFAAYQYVKATSVDWLMLCPPEIRAGAANGDYVTAVDYFPTDGLWFITAGNIGHYIAHEITNQQFSNTRIGIATKGDGDTRR